MKLLRYLDPEDRVFFFFFNRVFSAISVVPRETTLTISVSTSEHVPMQSEIVRVVSLTTTKITDIPRVEIRSSGTDTLTLTQTSHCFYVSAVQVF